MNMKGRRSYPAEGNLYALLAPVEWGRVSGNHFREHIRVEMMVDVILTATNLLRSVMYVTDKDVRPHVYAPKFIREEAYRLAVALDILKIYGHRRGNNKDQAFSVGDNHAEYTRIKAVA